MKKKTLGVIGGLGPIATAHFMELVIRMTQAEQDQQHLDMIVYHAPSIPDRSSYILDRSLESPLEPMIRLGRRLEEQGVGCIAIPCVTAHYFHRELQEGVHAPILNAVELTARELSRAGIGKAGILATTGTVRAGLFQRALEERGITPLVPGARGQEDVMRLIFENIKAGRPAEPERLDRVARELRMQGAQVLILGCTELSLLAREMTIGEGYLDALEILAREAVCRCGGTLRPEYARLLPEQKEN